MNSVEIEKKIERNVEHWAKQIFKGIAIFLFFVVLFLIAVYVLMRLWNWLMPELFGLITIDYWQALGILVLAKLIFGFGGGGDSKKHKNKAPHKKSFKKDLKCGSWRREFSEWELYDDFWAEEGEKAFKDYINRKNNNHENKQENNQ